MGLLDRWDERNQQDMNRANVEMSNENYERRLKAPENRTHAIAAACAAIFGLVIGLFVTGGESLSILARLGIAVVTALGFVGTVALLVARSVDD